MIKGDSVEYDKLAEWVKTLPIYSESPSQILTCEIGVREGLGSKIIMDEITDMLQSYKYKFRDSEIKEVPYKVKKSEFIFLPN